MVLSSSGELVLFETRLRFPQAPLAGCRLLSHNGAERFGVLWSVMGCYVKSPAPRRAICMGPMYGHLCMGTYVWGICNFRIGDMEEGEIKG
jgi:hypothetical protein